MLKVEVVYVTAAKSVIKIKCDLAEGATVGDALQCSGVLLSHPEVANFQVGVFAKKVPPDTPLKNGDRVEIYRTLVSDPKEKRRQRAKLKK